MDIAHLPHVAGIVLAAGRSTRMGQSKLLMPFRGEALIRPVLRAALTRNNGGHPLLWPVVAVTAPYSPPELQGIFATCEGLHCVKAADAADGMAHSLRAALREVLLLSYPVVPDGVCVLLGDQPLVDGPTLYTLLDAFALRPDAFIVPTYRGKRGNPVIIPYFFYEDVEALSGDTGARGFLLRPDVTVRTVEVSSPAVLQDVDTPEAYGELCARHG